MSRRNYRFVWLPTAAICALAAACSSPPDPSSKQLSGRMSADARARIAAAAEASGDEDLALSMYAAASAEEPTNSQLQLHYADILVRSGKIGPARDVLTKGLASASDPMQIRRGLGALDVLSGRNEQGIAELDKVLTVHPADVRALVDKAVALDLLGKHTEAQQLYSQARAVAPDDPVIANNLALSMALQGQVREARDLLLPFKEADNLPERVKVTMRILSGASGEAGPSPQAGDDEIKRMALALVSAGHGGAGDETFPSAAGH